MQLNNFELAKSHFLAGLEFFRKELYLEAETAFRTLLLLVPHRESTLTNLSATLSKIKSFDEAEKIARQALKLNNLNAEAWINLGNAFEGMHQFENAKSSYEKATVIKPDYSEGWCNLGNILLKLHQYNQAINLYDHAITLKPDFSEAWYNRGNALQELKQYEQAINSYDKAIEILPSFADAYWNKSLIQLLTADFQGGWKNYEYRWLCDEAENKKYQNIPCLNNLEEANSATVLVWWEQGFGDTIQFSRYVPLLAKMGATVIFEVQPPLKSLLMRSFPSIKIITKDEPINYVDFQIPLMSLPRLFATDINNIPSSKLYLTPHPGNLASWQNKLTLDGSKLNIGIACSGSLAHKKNIERSIPLSIFKPLIGLANLFVIQKELKDSDEFFLNQFPEIKFLGDEILSFEDSASIVNMMHYVISVDTSLAHLSGALGKPTMVLLPFNSEWRWLIDRADCPWYPSIKIFRQSKPGDWNSVIHDIVSEINFQMPLSAI